MELLIKKPEKKHRRKKKNFFDWWNQTIKGDFITNEEFDNILKWRK